MGLEKLSNMPVNTFTRSQVAGIMSETVRFTIMSLHYSGTQTLRLASKILV